MLVRVKTYMAGPGVSLVPGDVREFPDAEALRLVQAGYAEPVEKCEATVVVAAKRERRKA